MKYDVVLVNAHFSESTHNQRMCFPLGILYLGSLLKQAGFKIKLLDYNLNPKALLSTETELTGLDSSVYAITSLSSGYSFVKNIIRTIKKVSPDSRVVLGGAITYSIPELILNQTQADIVVEGEAESFIVSLIKKLLKNDTLSKEERIIRMDKKNVVEDLDSLPFPEWSLLDTESYITKSLHAWHSVGMRSFPIMASRGCPYNCNFCCKSLGHKVRMRSSANVAVEIKTAIDIFGIDDIWFIDEEFALTQDRVIELCDALKGLHRKLSFACSMRVDKINDAVLKSMREAGCRRIIYGVESGSQKILNAMAKGFTVEAAERAIIATRKQGIEAYVNFMFAYPGEDEKTIRQTTDFMQRLGLY